MATPTDKSPWPFFALGVGAVLTVGILGALWLLFRRLGTLQSGSNLGLQGGYPGHFPSGAPPFTGNGNYFAGPVHFALSGAGQNPSAASTAMLAPPPDESITTMTQPVRKTAKTTTMMSYTLDSVTSQRVFTATDISWQVSIRVLGPPGTFGVFSTNSTLLNEPGAVVGQTLIIPAGSFNKIDLAPRDTLYGKGTLGSTMISIAASPNPDYD